MAKANTVFINSLIEADLVIQGDPSLDDPYTVRGASCGIIVIAPYHLESGLDCPDWSPPSGSLAGSNCITQMSNSNWFIKGVSHEIKPGSYTTTLHVYMTTPGGTSDEGSPLGNDPGADTI